MKDAISNEKKSKHCNWLRARRINIYTSIAITASSHSFPTHKLNFVWFRTAEQKCWKKVIPSKIGENYWPPFSIAHRQHGNCIPRSQFVCWKIIYDICNYVFLSNDQTFTLLGKENWGAKNPAARGYPCKSEDWMYGCFLSSNLGADTWRSCSVCCLLILPPPSADASYHWASFFNFRGISAFVSFLQ